RDRLLVRFSHLLPQGCGPAKKLPGLTAAFERVRCTGNLAGRHIALGLNALLIARTGPSDPRHLQAVSSGGAGGNEWGDAQPIPAHHVSDSRDPLATPFNIGTIDAVALTAIRTGNGQHDVYAQLPNRDDGDFTRLEI